MTDHNRYMASTKAPEAPLKNEAFVSLLKRHRLAKGYTQTELARKLDLKTPSTISFWESGESLPRPDLFPKLARVLGISPLELTRVISPDDSKEAIATK